MILQHKKEEMERDNQSVLYREVLDIIKDNFDDMHNQMKGRSNDDQLIIGGTLTTLELEIKKEIKMLVNKNIK